MCDSFAECITNPYEGTAAEGRFGDVNTLTFYSVNLFLYIMYAVLTVWVALSLFKTVYVLIGSDSSESQEKFRNGITNAVLAAVGIVLIVGARFILATVLGFLGIPDAENIYMG